MRLTWILVLASWIAAPAIGATSLGPEMTGPEGQRAFDDLAALYADGKPVAAMEQALKDLAGNVPAAREVAARYLLALLRQSLADESNGRARWKALPFWGGGAESASREFRKRLADKIATGPAAPELLEAELWLINSDRVPADAQAGANALTRNPSSQVVDAYRSLLSPAHPNTTVVVTIIRDIGRRKLAVLAPEVTAVCNDFRSGVREAAREVAATLNLTNIPVFTPERALSGFVELQLSNISALVLTPIAKDAQWKRFSVKLSNSEPERPDHRDFSGWLLAEDPGAYHVLDLFGQEQSLARTNVTLAARTLADDAKAILQIRVTKFSKSAEDPRARLSSSGMLTGQFEPGFVSAPEALLAAWTLERGDRSNAAALILPCFDRAGDARWIAEAVRDLLAKRYQQQMLDAFTRDRDYPAVNRIARHLGKTQFQGWQYFERTRKLAAQLENRGDDFRTLVLPTPDEWKDLRSKLARPAQVEYLAARMRLLNAFQWGQPGGVDFDEAQTREAPSSLQARPGKKEGTQTINPLVELHNMQLQVKDLPALLPYLDDDNFVLAYGYWRDFHPARYLYTVNSFIVELVNHAAACELIDWDTYSRADEREQKTLREKALEWISANSGRTRTDLLLEKLRDSAGPGPVLAAARELARNKEPAALPLMFRRIENLPKAEDQASLAECCFRLAPERSVEQARKWINQSGELRFWAAMILFSNGDWSRREGWAELNEALANDNTDLTAYRRAFDSLLKSGKPEALELAVGVLKKFKKDTSVWTIQPFVHRLFLAGRHEALDYLLAALDDKTPAGSTSTVVDGKRVRIELTKADEVAENLSYLRKDKHLYSETAPEAERSSERQKLKGWLAEQMALIRNGKESGVRTNVGDLAVPNWMLDTP